MIGSNRDFQVLHYDSTGAVVRGVFEGGGSYFKATFDLLVPSGNDGVSVNIWDFKKPLVDAGTVTPIPQSYLLLITDFHTLWGDFAPVPGSSIEGGGLIAVNLQQAKYTDGFTPTLATNLVTIATPPQYILNTNINAAMPPVGATDDLTWASISVVPGDNVTRSGYLRCIVMGKML